MSYQSNIYTSPEINSASTDLLGRQRVCIPKNIANYTNIFNQTVAGSKFDIKGTGTVTASNSVTSLNVTAGQFLVLQSKEFHYYVAGQPQKIDLTFNNFQSETGLIKRFGYFSSNAVTPYSSNFDGIFVESNENSIDFVVVRDGVEVYRDSSTSWTNASELVGYDWSKFTISQIDFLWLGGKDIRLCLQKSNGEFIEAHRINYAQNNILPFCLSPNQPLRCEIRSTTGSGQFNFICGAVSRDDGSFDVEMRKRAVFQTTTPFNITTIGTRYILGALRKQTTRRNSYATVIGGGVALTTSDTLAVELVKGGTVTGTLTFNNLTESSLQYAQGNGTQTLSGGTQLDVVLQNNTAFIDVEKGNLLANLNSDLDNNMEVIYLVATPLTANISVTNTMKFNELF